MNRKPLALTLATAICLTAFAGCGGAASKETAASASTATSTASSTAESKAESTAEPVTLHFWMGIPPEAGPQAVVDAFNEEYKDKGIQVEYERYVNDDQGNLKLETSLMSGGDIDVFVTYGNYRTIQRAEAGMSMDLTPFMEKDNFDYGKLFSEEAKACYVNGVPYSMYTTVGKGSLLVNEDMFKEAGLEIPTSWTYEEFREACKKLTHGEGQDKVYGMFWNSPQNMGEYMSYLSQAYLGGNWIYNEDGKTSRLNDPHTVAAMQLVYDTMNTDGTAPTHADSVTQKLTQESVFLTGHSAMTVGNWAIRSVKDTAQYPHEFKTAYVPYPTEDGKPEYVYGGFGDEISMNSKTANPDQAWEFMKWYATNGIKYMSAGGRIGLCNELDSDEMMTLFGAGYENLINLDSAKNCLLVKPTDKLTVPTISTNGSEIMQSLNEELEAAMNKQETVQEALDNATQRADKILAG